MERGPEMDPFIRRVGSITTASMALSAAACGPTTPPAKPPAAAERTGNPPPPATAATAQPAPRAPAEAPKDAPPKPGDAKDHLSCVYPYFVFSAASSGVLWDKHADAQPFLSTQPFGFGLRLRAPSTELPSVGAALQAMGPGMNYLGLSRGSHREGMADCTRANSLCTAVLGSLGFFFFDAWFPYHEDGVPRGWYVAQLGAVGIATAGAGAVHASSTLVTSSRPEISTSPAPPPARTTRSLFDIVPLIGRAPSHVDLRQRRSREHLLDRRSDHDALSRQRVHGRLARGLQGDGGPHGAAVHHQLCGRPVRAVTRRPSMSR